MRFLLTLAAYAALTVSAFAQTPREMTAADTLGLRIGQTKAFSVDRSIVSFENTSETVAKVATIGSDQQFIIQGVGPGEALITVNYANGSFYRFSVLVGGRIVRIYSGKGDNAKDYTGHFCTETECSRADTDIAAPVPNSMSVARTTRDSSGNIITTTKNY
jgi:hypothetical protein